jgi:hypothetical protein
MVFYVTIQSTIIRPIHKLTSTNYEKSIMALSATLLLELQFLHKSSVRRIQFRQWPTCHFTKRPFGTSCDNIRNVSRRCQKMKIQKELVCSFFRTFLFEGTENIKAENGLKL